MRSVGSVFYNMMRVLIDRSVVNVTFTDLISDLI
jgi:hypothetical protein